MQEKNDDVIFTSKLEKEGKIDEFPELNNTPEEENNGEPKELTEEEKHELFIKQLKESKIKFKPIKHIGNTTINKFGTAFKKERKRKNKQAKASRKANRK